MKYLSSQPHGMSSYDFYSFIFICSTLIFHHENYLNCSDSYAIFVLTSAHKSSVLNFTDLSSSKVFFYVSFLSYHSFHNDFYYFLV